jgi:hypothetical protein
MYEGLLVHLIDRCQGDSKRHELILSILESTALSNEEVKFLFSLLAKETDLDEESHRRISIAEERLHPNLDLSEIELLEGSYRLQLIP